MNKEIEELLSIQNRNVINDIFQLIFHLKGTDDELREYYGGGVNRQTLIEGTIKSLKSDALVLKFIQKHKDEIKTYAGKFEDGSLEDYATREYEQFIKERNVDKGSKKATKNN